MELDVAVGVAHSCYGEVTLCQAFCILSAAASYAHGTVFLKLMIAWLDKQFPALYGNQTQRVHKARHGPGWNRSTFFIPYETSIFIDFPIYPKVSRVLFRIFLL
jgi:hypothetical protein